MGRPRRAPDEELVAVVISASGRTPEVVADGRERHAGRGLVVAVTNDPDAPLGRPRRPRRAAGGRRGESRASPGARSGRPSLPSGLLTGATPSTRCGPAVDGLAARLASEADGSSGMADELDGAPSIDVPGRRRAAGRGRAGGADASGGAPAAGPRLRDGRLAAHRGVPGPARPPGRAAAGLAGRRRGHRARSSAGAGRSSHRRAVGADGPIARAIVDSLVAERLAATLCVGATRASDRVLGRDRVEGGRRTSPRRSMVSWSNGIAEDGMTSPRRSAGSRRGTRRRPRAGHRRSARVRCRRRPPGRRGRGAWPWRPRPTRPPRTVSRTTTWTVTVRSMASNGRPTSAQRWRRTSDTSAMRAGSP